MIQPKELPNFVWGNSNAVLYHPELEEQGTEG